MVQINHYYPFGLNQEGQWTPGGTGANKYQYNGKELNTDLELNWNDYGARWYAAAICRWGSVDPSVESGGQESYSPYHYVFGNPIIHTDPDGRNPIVGVVAAAAVSAAVTGFFVGAITEIATQTAVNFATNQSISNIDWADVGISGVVGAATEGMSVLGYGAKALKAVSIGGEVAKSGMDAKTEANGGVQYVGGDEKMAVKNR